MSENTFPEKIQEVVSDVVETVADKLEVIEEKIEEKVDVVEDLADKSLAELSELFDKLKGGADSMLRSKEAESIKSAFYKLLSKLKGEDEVKEESFIICRIYADKYAIKMIW